MPFTIIRNDITRMAVDAIVNSAAPHLLGGGGADGAIHRAAGPELREACRRLGGCRQGEIKVTEGFQLPCRYVFHTVGPVWLGGGFGEEKKLRRCYRNAMEKALEMELETIAFPLISGGLFGFPQERALCAAMDEVRDFVLKHDLMVYLVVYSPEAFRISARLEADIRQYIDDAYVSERAEQICNRPDRLLAARREVFADVDYCAEPDEAYDWEELSPPGMAALEPAAPEASVMEERCIVCQSAAFPCPQVTAPLDEEEQNAVLKELLRQRDESFTERLLRLIDESGLTDPECYRRANVDRRLFSKIRNNPHYQPTKQTALAFAIALRLDRAATDELLRSAGLALTGSSHFDLIVDYFIRRGNYDMMQINQALYSFDLPLLGNQ